MLTQSLLAQVAVVCPEGAGPGFIIEVPVGDKTVQLEIPDGVYPGDEFIVEVDLEGSPEPREAEAAAEARAAAEGAARQQMAAELAAVAEAEAEWQRKQQEEQVVATAAAAAEEGQTVLEQDEDQAVISVGAMAYLADKASGMVFTMVPRARCICPRLVTQANPRKSQLLTAGGGRRGD